MNCKQKVWWPFYATCERIVRFCVYWRRYLTRWAASALAIVNGIGVALLVVHVTSLRVMWFLMQPQSIIILYHLFVNCAVNFFNSTFRNQNCLTFFALCSILCTVRRLTSWCTPDKELHKAIVSYLASLNGFFLFFLFKVSSQLWLCSVLKN